MNSPLLPVTAGLAAGIVVSRYMPHDTVWYAVILIVCLALAARLARQRLAAVMLLGVLTGVAVERVDGALSPSATVPAPGTQFTACAVVTDMFDGPLSTRLIVQLDPPYGGNCYLTVPHGGTDLRVGDEVAFTARLLPLACPRDVDGDIDMSDFYYRRYITSRAIVTDGSIALQGQRDGLTWRFARYREHLIDLVMTDCASGVVHRELIVALLLGDTSMLDSDTRPDFTRAGVAHLLALSGMHVAVIAMLLAVLFWPLAWFGARRGRWLAVIAVLWLYALLTGMSPSVVRAVVMYSAILVARMVGRPGSSANALALAALLIILVSPRRLFAPGFQLSFLAVAALVTIPPLLPRVDIHSRPLHWLYYYIVYTLAATCGTMLLVAYRFHILPLGFLVTNLPFAFLLPPFMVGGIVWLAITALGLHSGPLDSCLDGLADLMYGIAHHAASLPYTAVDGIYFPLWALIAGYLGIILLLVACRRRPRWPWLSGGVVGLLLLALSGWLDRPSANLLFIARSSSSTDIVYTHGGRAHIITSARPHELPERIEAVTTRYADFLGRRGISAVVTDNASSPSGNRALAFGPHRVAVVNSAAMPCDTAARYDYLVVCRGFTGDVVGLSRSLRADTVLLGTDINGRRRHRYERELAAAGQPVRSLENSYGLVLVDK